MIIAAVCSSIKQLVNYLYQLQIKYIYIYRVAHKKRPELSHGIMQQRNQNESTE